MSFLRTQAFTLDRLYTFPPSLSGSMISHIGTRKFEPMTGDSEFVWIWNKPHFIADSLQLFICSHNKKSTG